jgi:hypothetical protein
MIGRLVRFPPLLALGAALLCAGMRSRRGSMRC